MAEVTKPCDRTSFSGTKKERTALLIEISVPSNFGLNNAEIKKITKYQDLNNEIKSSWKLKGVEIVPPVIYNWSNRKNKDEPHWDFENHPPGTLPQTNYNWRQSRVR